MKHLSNFVATLCGVLLIPIGIFLFIDVNAYSLSAAVGLFLLFLLAVFVSGLDETNDD